MTKNNRMSGAFDNQVAAFINNYCEESPEFRERMAVLFNTYCHYHLSLTQGPSRGPYHNRHMTESSFNTRIRHAEFDVERLRTGRGLERHLYVLGLRVKDQEWAQREKFYIEHPSERGYAEHRTESINNPISVHIPKPKVVPIDCSNIKGTHIEIRGVLYEKNLIATIRPIRKFKRFDNKEEMSYIVTFTNAELKHQFISEDDAHRIKQQISNQGVA